MKFSLESKYDPGDKVYVLLGWVYGIRVKQREVESITGITEQGIKYNLKPIGDSRLFNSPRLEKHLFLTEQEAIKAGEEKNAEYKVKKKEKLKTDIQELKNEAQERIDNINERLKEDIEFIQREIERI